ncbi:MAG: phage shock protein operon transcriptional activator [Gammaproteobacteria bacterium]|nr:phage shock protein operon transcriptional activator [Gammaproteobacteria bacterium]MCY4324352.1 phage shock protein operon transcriptional activator [Gammaproteobacteria bacterium]
MARESEQCLGASRAFLNVLEQVSQVAPLDRPVLIVGERGAGKELIAERLHFLSERWDAPYLKVNCAALSESLLESELFGHEAGAFTGATRTHKGRFERADQGTLFLDELASTSGAVQEKVLRIIEYGEFERLGGDATRKVNVRLIAAANEDLPDLARRRQFRADLLDRLAFDVITLPPLREREDDVLLLAEHFALNMSVELGRELFPGFTQEAVQSLLGYQWPGNVRELKNLVERAVYRAHPKRPISKLVFDPFDSPYRPSGEVSSTDDARLSFPMDLRIHMEKEERQIIEKALEKARFNQRQAAELLGLSYDQLRGLLKKYQLSRRRKGDEHGAA